MKKIYDIIGIGIGPFNLGLAALAYMIPELSCIFFDQSECFEWHTGLLLDNARLQVPYYADLVTLADPQSPFTYLAFLKAKQRLFRFAIHEQYFPTRKEYNQYCKWVVGHLPNLHFSKKCQSIQYDQTANVYTVQMLNRNNNELETHCAKQICLGIGTVPAIPSFAADLNHPNIIHSSQYLPNKKKLLDQESVTIVGSGQSAAEIFYDLLPYREQFGNNLHWFTRSPRYYPMDYSKFALEMTSPDYIDHFHSLEQVEKDKILPSQHSLYKGINVDLIKEIYDTLYLQDLDQPIGAHQLHPNCELKAVNVFKETGLHLQFHHHELKKDFEHMTGALLLATGYKPSLPQFIEPIRERIQWDSNHRYQANRNYSIDSNNSIFIQNAEINSHGFNAADLGMGPYRNAIILNTILGYERFPMEKNIAFQQFGLPKK